MAKRKDKEIKKGLELAVFLAELAKDTKAFNPEKGASLDHVLELLEESLKQVIQKSIEDRPDVKVTINKQTGEISAYSFLTVVGDEEMESPYTQITVSEAIEEYDPEAEVGDEVILDDSLDVNAFGRMAMLHTRQLLSQKVKDHEREKIKDEFSVRIGELISGDVRHIERGNIVVNLGRTDAILPRNQQIKGDRYTQGDRIRAVIHDVKDNTKGAQVILSRTSPKFLERLLEVEVPDIYQKTISVVKIERNPGFRAKVALETADPRVDPVGACLGVRGSRIQGIVRELANERIDVFQYSDDVITLARRVLSATKVSNVIPVGEKKVVLVVAEEELAKAIGKEGSNIKLTSRFLDREVVILGEDEFDDLSEEERAKLLSAKGEEIEMLDIDNIDNIVSDDSDSDEEHTVGVEEVEDEETLGAQLVDLGAEEALDELSEEKE